MAFGNVFSGAMGFFAAVVIAFVVLVVVPMVGCTLLVGGCVAVQPIQRAQEAAEKAKANYAMKAAIPPVPATESDEKPASEPDDASEPQEAVYRVWRDASGDFGVEAQLVSSDGVHVTLRRADGNTISVPLVRLSEADRQWLDENQPKIETVH